MFDPKRKAVVFSTRKPEVFLPAEFAPAQAQRTAAIPQRSEAQSRDSLSCLLSVLAVPRWMAGLWQDDIVTGSVFSEVPGGWFNHRWGVPVFLSFVDARQWIDERIAELGLDADLVNAWPTSKHSIEWEREFYALPFEERVDIFRARK